MTLSPGFEGQPVDESWVEFTHAPVLYAEAGWQVDPNDFWFWIPGTVRRVHHVTKGGRLLRVHMFEPGRHELP